MRLSLLILSLIIPLFGHAQPTQTLRGRVVDRESKYPLVGATVQSVDVKMGSLTDSAGNYRIAGVPVGRRTVQRNTGGLQRGIAQ